LAYSSTLKTEAAISSEMVNLYQTKRCHISEEVFFIVITVRTSNSTFFLCSRMLYQLQKLLRTNKRALVSAEVYEIWK
jgi:hypothetical protein